MFMGEYPWQRRLRFSFDGPLKDELKQFPGVSWRDTKWGKEWICPVEAVPFVSRITSKYNYVLESYGVAPSTPAPFGTLSTATTALQCSEKLWPFQASAVQKILASPEPSFILNFEMGLGKTPTVIEVLRLKGIRDVLIVCPAMVRKNWIRELHQWWPQTASQSGGMKTATAPTPDLTNTTFTKELPAPVSALDSAAIAITEITTGDEAENYRYVPGITIVSYGLLHKLPKIQVGAIVFDELHYLQGENAARTVACIRLLRDNPHAWCAGLTGTLISNEPVSMWKPLDVLFPGRFGTRNQFGARYCKADVGSFGSKYFGVNPDFVEELRERLDRFSVRATKREPEIARLLPPFTVVTAETSRTARLNDAADFAIDSYRQGTRKLAVLTHLKKSAAYIAARIRKAVGPECWVGLVTGDDGVKARDVLLSTARDFTGPTFLVATMHAVGIGIDLTWSEDVTFAELDYSPTIVAQAFGRFSRLSGVHGVLVRVLLDGAGDPVGDSLANKVRAMGSIIAAGQAESGIANATQGVEEVLTAEEKAALLQSMSEDMYD